MTTETAPASVEAMARRAASQLLNGGDGIDLQHVAGGGNNRVYRISRDGMNWAMKLYAPSGTAGADAAERLHHEFDGLRYLNDNHIEMVPQALAVDREQHVALYEWIDGERLALQQPADRQPSDIQAISIFVAQLHGLSRQAKPGFDTMAKEACLSGKELVRQVEQRLIALNNLTGEDDLTRFLKEHYLPALSAAAHRLENWATKSGHPLSDELPQAQRILSPSDFGFHNALRRADGHLTFIDFEYFGWDDPVKLLADFLWHPALGLSMQERVDFISESLSLLSVGDTNLAERFMAQFPLFGLRWAAILLNEYFPERWQRRVFAGKGTADPEAWSKAKFRQLSRARRYLQITEAATMTAPQAQVTELLYLLDSNP